MQNSFNDITHKEQMHLLEGMVGVSELLAIGDIAAIALEEYNNEIIKSPQ